MADVDRVKKTEEEWKKELSPEEYHVLREKGTEPAFSGEYYHEKEKGMYRCRACGAELFSSDDKYDSGSGWPSYDKPVEDGAVEALEDRSHGMVRTEVICKRCGSHLGHVFDDGPVTMPNRAGTGKRFCINSRSLTLEKDTPHT